MNNSTAQIVSYTIDRGIAEIVMNDGKGNVISPRMLQQLHGALDRAEAANAVVVLSGNEQIFCAGFDLSILKTGVLDAFKMIIGGFSLSRRLLAFPTPVIIACNGHAVAMGAFLLLSGDYRIGADGDGKIVANEVKIGLTMPHSAIVICRQRLSPAHFHRAVLLSETYQPQQAVAAGFLDRVVPAEKLLPAARDMATALTGLDPDAHRRSKLRMRKALLKNLSAAIRSDQLDFFLQGIRRMFSMR